MNIDDFYNGNEWNAHTYFGAHITEVGVIFRVYAPQAKRVALIGEFNGWKEVPMLVQGMGGIYTIFVKQAKAGQMYKYRIYHMDGSVVDKADPYGFFMELRPCSASVIVPRNTDVIRDEEYMKTRELRYNQPMNIYEIHFGSWRKKEGEWYRYEEMGKMLIPYLKDMGYTHVELMPLNEHPYDGSWGYQITGFFALTSRYGEISGFKKFVEQCHAAGIGVILDFVMVHFAVDDYGISRFDGTMLYEHPDEMEKMTEWGTYPFAHGRGEVASFLKSCANYWISEFHLDGLRVDAVSHMIYRGGMEKNGENTEGIRFLKSWNEGLHNMHPGVMLIAEDSTNYLKGTAPVAYNGLGFDYKWDLGFMNDTLLFFSKDCGYRKKHYGALLFSMHYFYNELHLLAISHDENVHGKKTILDKMYGSYEEKFANARAFFAYMMTHPGKKLNFMGNEIGQFREWDEGREQDFDVLLSFEMHQKFQRFFRDMNQIYKNHKGLYEGEYNPACFRFLVDSHNENVVYAYERTAGDERIIVILNLNSEYYVNYRIPLEGNHQLEKLINTDWEIYGGRTPKEETSLYGRNGQLVLNLPSYSAQILQVK